jgi:hypothetical protein
MMELVDRVQVLRVPGGVVALDELANGSRFHLESVVRIA